METRYNTRSPAVKRLMREAQELSQATDQYFAQPLEDNLFEWHFTVRGPSDSDFQNGIYHGRIILPVDYPMKPPSIIWLTPNGRFETNKKICLSISGHHPESWQPSWSIRTALLAIIGFMPTHPNGAIGSLDYTPEERKILAKKSKDWKCPVCGDISDVLLEPNSESIVTEKEAKELANHIDFQVEKPKSNDGEPMGGNAAPCTTVCTTSQTDDHYLASSRIPFSVYDTAATAFTVGGQSPVVMSAYRNLGPRVMPNTPTNYPAAAYPAPYSQFHSGPPAGEASMPNFPYPPSRYMQCGYSSFFRSGCSLPPGVGMFPCPPYPRVASPCSSRYISRPYCCSIPVPVPVPVPTQNVKATDTGEDNIFREGVKSKDSEDDMSPKTEGTSQKPSQRASYDVDKAISPSKSDKGKSLKTEKMSQGEEQVSPYPDQNVNTSSISADSSKSKECVNSVNNSDSFQKDPRGVDVGGFNKDFSSDSEKETCLLIKKASPIEVNGLELTNSELHVVDEDSSDTGIPQIEVSDTEQRSHFEKSISNSLPDLEKVRQSNVKGLRHRQSAPGQAMSDVSEVSQSSASSDVTGTRRIEAASGDNPHRTSPQGIRIVQLGRGGQQQDREQQSSFSIDGMFLLMVALSLVFALILLNRILHMVDWSEMGSKL
ncbi:hypothetical protein BgiMline_016700 [Biomphalaria glabrata]|uniref:Uncharacterized protein LOC106078704 n=1 Tax=Biomphalaria glabrata TaxID=6526 RepID=A0A9W3AP84_BIOGL|nr:uncharacterized protein LOC106078704 [Biomphalaria glabrata]KAI8758874.1 ubiquitin-conjugating enzyme E2 J1-like isoform X3 [Biomphalaria glabrata]KAI8792358.1 ubiquitin-conjugating enzyme E2 J1 isoform X3 [Biomphalaria glabrata]